MRYSLATLAIVLILSSCQFSSKTSSIHKVEEIHHEVFNKELSASGIRFSVSYVKEISATLLTIKTVGLEAREFNETIDVQGDFVVGAEVADLNSDGSPELFVFTQSPGSGSYGKVYAFSVNNKKSMSQVYFQPTSENKAISEGYMGHDAFSISENSLVQRFPIYKRSDSNANPTGGMRKVSYKLLNGEAGRKLVVDRVTTY
ncbi:PliI family lysozyme inhibitor of I-type lysozyme [Saccharicrinis aurantiacus]|uniref:PliI family lysozyme inhibitor of I-type lysozyme n=1 Tax=Saccharicrinis aurantiacus TaxID=1849719 RepID=UPI002490C953|nr:PliI family lysozyme inhibitor of I-type lysozyme [Saccharicrinis aurantiacus]